MGYKVKITEPCISLSNKIEYPYSEVTPFNIICYLRRLLKKKNCNLPRPAESYMKEAAKFLDDFGPDQTIWIMETASHHCKNFGFKYMREVAKNEGIFPDDWRASKSIGLF